MIRAPGPRRRAVLIAAAMCAAACGDDGVPEAEDPTPAARDTASAPPRPAGRRYERALAFVTTAGDSALVVPWLMSATSRAGGVDRTARAWLVRGGEWEAFLDQSWTTAPTRAPWRILPRGPMRIVVGEDEALESLIYSAAPRELEIALDEALTDWTGRGGASFRLLQGGLVLGEGRSEGLLVDMTRSVEPAAAAGDWAFLVSGPALQIVLHAPVRAGNLFQGWARLDFRELAFPAIEIVPAETRAFDPARREVPVAWTVRSPDGGIAGRLEVVSATLAAGEGAGPQLPVDAIFEVTGTLVIQGTEHVVRGLFRHTQG